jgi:hypothetical protein
VLRFEAQTNNSYTVEYRAGVETGSVWTILSNIGPPASAGPIQVADPGGTTNNRRFLPNRNAAARAVSRIRSQMPIAAPVKGAAIVSVREDLATPAHARHTDEEHGKQWRSVLSTSAALADHFSPKQ